MNHKNLSQATLGGGCFWCLEAVFQRLKGVYKVESGYAGGDKPNPTYQEVCSGKTGHAEVAQITFDPEVISYEELLEVFWHTHDPTTLNRQGNDVGTQYRSIIFYHDPEQQRIAEASKQRTDGSDLWKDPIVTEIAPLTRFYPAENYHQNYYNRNPAQGYCTFIISPKLKKLQRDFGDKLEEGGATG